MAHRKAGGTAKNLNDSKPKYLGTKLYDGEKAGPGSIIVRQRGTRILAGTGVKMGKDHTIYSIKVGTVKFTDKRKTNFNGKTKKLKVASVHPME
ncbi:MAG: 50S ribosomal protein L27 [Patescibacteria group bacterium]